MIDIVGITNDLKADEGYRQTMYFDSLGVPTIGYGRNLRNRGLNEDEASYLLANDIQAAIDDLQLHLSWFDALSPNRQKALVEMCFQLGIAGLLNFVNMLKDMASGDFKSAMKEALGSKWALQVPRRAARVADLILNG